MKIGQKTFYVSAVLFVFGNYAAHAITLIQDSFNRTGPLAGSSPSYSITGGTWSGPIGGYTTSPNAAITNPLVAQPHAFTTPTLLINTTYTLSVIMGNQTGPNDPQWLAFGFGQSFSGDGGIIVDGAGGSYAYGSYPFPTIGSNIDRFTITLTTGNLLSNSLISYARSTGPIGISHITDASAFGSSIYFQKNANAQGYYSDLLLTATPVPETSSALLGLVGVLGLAIRRRRC
jgi:MYXO-CTERM domain-containing protein